MSDAAYQLETVTQCDPAADTAVSPPVQACVASTPRQTVSPDQGLVFRGVLIGLPIAALGWGAVYVIIRAIIG
jgi:hypothetical protein